eukprot:TRINITY_DN34753_c0_g1_i1.p1 TRINITY_DN34753_c0_g1~~TRINITY_DN34753_c0_g1_i1.p1  ORF type:complete len:137 (-),score=43.58 TRINITY_DN34753_c0_g1_i1:93-503(-)
MKRRPPRSTLSSSSAASDVYKRQLPNVPECRAVYGFDGYFSQTSTYNLVGIAGETTCGAGEAVNFTALRKPSFFDKFEVYPTTFAYLAPSGPFLDKFVIGLPVSYTHLRAHETPEHLVCRLLLEKKKTPNNIIISH